MGQDLRKLFEEKKKRSEGQQMPEGHEARFAERLQSKGQEKPEQGIRLWIWRVAIAAAVLLAIFFGWKQTAKKELPETIIPADELVQQETGPDNVTTPFTMGDISPDLQKVEQFYVNQINYQLSQLPLHQDQDEVVDEYLKRLAELDADYKALNKELYQQGPNDQLVAALIQNLQLRLELISKLQKQLDQLKSSENEQVSIITI